MNWDYLFVLICLIGWLLCTRYIEGG